MKKQKENVSSQTLLKILLNFKNLSVVVYTLNTHKILYKLNVIYYWINKFIFYVKF